MKIRSIKKRQTTQSESPFWISFADLMSALMILFLVVMAVSLMAVTKDINEEATAETQRAQEIFGSFGNQITGSFRPKCLISPQVGSLMATGNAGAQ